MPESTKEVFERFTQGQDEGNILPYLCYAIFAAERYEWAERCLENYGQYPDGNEERRWISELPENYFAKIERRATNWMDEFARDYLDETIEEEKNEAVENSIRPELSSLNRFWPAFWNNVAGGVVAAIIFAIIVFAVAFLVFGNISPVDMAKEVSSN